MKVKLVTNDLIQGPLHCRTGRNTPTIPFFEITRLGNSNYTPGLDMGEFFGPYFFIIKEFTSLSIEGSNIFRFTTT